MKKQLNFLMGITILALCTSCSNKTKEVQSVIDKYCALNTKVHNTDAGAEKVKAIAEKKAFEKEVDDKYFSENKTYQLILDGMKKCDEGFSSNEQTNGPSESSNTNSNPPSAYGDAVTVAQNYCDIIDKSISLAQNGTDTELKEMMATRVIFENNLDESFKDNPLRRDSIFNLIKPCMQKEIAFKGKKQGA